MNSLLNPNLRLGMSAQVGETGHAQPRGLLLAHADRIGVVETERPAHAHAALGQGRAESGFVLESSFPPGSRPRSCRCTRDRRRAGRPRGRERGPVFRPARGDGCTGTPASRIRSRAISPRITDSVNTFDPTRTVRPGIVSHECEREENGEAWHQESPAAASSRSWRWALTNWVTNGSAGSSMSASSAPR